MTPYITEEDADAYFDERLRTSPWDDTTESSGDRLRALKEATRLIDRLNFKGDKTSSTQEREFPREEETTVPTDIQYACAEIALKLLDDFDPDMEVENLGIVSQGISTVKSTYDRSYVMDHLRAGIPSATAWSYLVPYLADSNAINVNRV